MTPDVFEKAPAKLNLGLRILGKRPDGYHDILSVFQTVTLTDSLCLEQSECVEFICSDFTIPLGSDNLVLRADELFSHAVGKTLPARFRLEKNIPVGAGLGGGSSDAAAAFRGLARFHGTSSAGDDVLYRTACALGSDIPFLIRGGTAVVSGRGENVEFVPWPFDFTYVIVYPGFGVSTVWAYGSLDGFHDDGGVYHDMTERLRAGTLSEDVFFAALVNDFEPTVIRNYPTIGEVKARLTAYGARASLMSGSGSSVFGIFDDSAAAGKCAVTMKNDFSEVFVVKKFG